MVQIKELWNGQFEIADGPASKARNDLTDPNAGESVRTQQEEINNRSKGTAGPSTVRKSIQKQPL